MKNRPTRRTALQTLGSVTALASVRSIAPACAQPPPSSESDPWAKTHDRVWLGGDYWANPMEDWKIVDGAAECQSSAGGRNIHWITRQLTQPNSGFELGVTIRQLEKKSGDGGAGFRIGITSDVGEHRSACFENGGIEAGLREGQLFINNKQTRCPFDPAQADIRLTLLGVADGNRVALKLIAQRGDQQTTIDAHATSAELRGNISVVNNFANQIKENEGARYRFSNWTASGEGFTHSPEQRFGPLLWTMYSLSDSRGSEGYVLKLSALTGPLSAEDNYDVELQVERTGKWQSLGVAQLDHDAWTATFRIANWDETQVTPYRVLYQERHRDGRHSESEWTGKIKANPVGRPLRLAAMTCQNQIGFPYEPVAQNVKKLDADLLYFSGDQLYESHGGFGIIREPAEPAILNYLRKFYMFGWSFRDCMRDTPTLCIPDDHDVFQGNIWGEGGAPMTDLDQGASSKGGYREPARMVNVVHKTNAAHHPDFHDDSPVKQGISVYYGDMVYGNVSFAILADRQFKSGPERVETGSGRADHVSDPNFNTAALDQPGLVLLGERQENFLKEWVNDWRGHSMKVLLSQTVFAGVATHHGRYNGYLKADLDSGGWPQTPRDNAIRILREGMPLHINGDQHLTSLVQYGVDKQRDSCWSFCTPAISVGYPRWWRADELDMPHTHRPKHNLPNTGEYLDGFGNKVFVYAVDNPIVPDKKNRYEVVHQKGSGFGFVTIDTQAKTYYLESFRFLVDATQDDPANQFPGWPVTIHQRENRGENVVE